MVSSIIVITKCIGLDLDICLTRLKCYKKDVVLGVILKSNGLLKIKRERGWGAVRL
jgi:hypothetical protein